MMVWKMIFLFQGCILRFLVNLPGCMVCGVISHHCHLIRPAIKLVFLVRVVFMGAVRRAMMKQFLGKSGIDIRLYKQLHKTWSNKNIVYQCPFVLKVGCWFLSILGVFMQSLLHDLICVYICSSYLLSISSCISKKCHPKDSSTPNWDLASISWFIRKARFPHSGQALADTIEILGCQKKTDLFVETDPFESKITTIWKYNSWMQQKNNKHVWIVSRRFKSFLAWFSHPSVHDHASCKASKRKAMTFRTLVRCNWGGNEVSCDPLREHVTINSKGMFLYARKTKMFVFMLCMVSIKGSKKIG